jgi:dCTP deaminase
MSDSSEGLSLPAEGILPAQWLRKAVGERWISSERTIPDSSFQPASLDLRLGEVAYRLRCSFLPGPFTVGDRLREYEMGHVDLRDGAILERNRPYLIPLLERLDLPQSVRAKANPRSSTGRVDVFTRVITDRGFTFDDVQPGYEGPLYLEVVSRSFTVRVRTGISLNQLRLVHGGAECTDAEIAALHSETPLLFNEGAPMPDEDVVVQRGLFLSLDMRGDEAGTIGYRAKKNSRLLDLSAHYAHDPADYWELVTKEEGNRAVLEPEEFYLLLSKEAVRIPPGYAAEMTAYDPTSGELRTHYAGFFDPGFGHSDTQAVVGSRAALEVRAHDVPFMVEDGQKVCKLAFERMVEPPDMLYGADVGSAYQGQTVTLSRHFRREFNDPSPTLPMRFS